MLRPNYAFDAPPEELTIGGHAYAIDWDWRTWLKALDLMKRFDVDGGLEGHNGETLLALEKLVFGGWLTEKPDQVLDALLAFARGYPDARAGASEGEEEPLCSFDHDINEIAIAIRDQHGVDLSWRRTEPLHWWEFLLLFRTLAGEHRILQLMEIRGYRGRDKELLRRKRAAALPRETSPGEEKLLEEIDQAFYAAR